MNSILSTTKNRNLKIKSAFAFMFLSLACFVSVFAQTDGIPRGAQLPYTRYESEDGTRGGAAALQQTTNHNYLTIAAEASNQKYVSLPSNGSFVEWTTSASFQGFNMRFTMPDNSTGSGNNGSLGLYINGTKIQNINLTSRWAYQYFPGGATEPVQEPVAESTSEPGGQVMMEFDEIHFKLANSYPAGTVIRIAKDNGDSFTYGVDFLELEPVPSPLGAPANSLSVTDFGANGSDNVDDLAAFYSCLNAAKAQGKNVYVPAGRFLLSDRLDFNYTNMIFQGAGIWHTEIFFSTDLQFSGGILARASNVDIGHFSLNTANNDRFHHGETNPKYSNVHGEPYKIYKGFMGTYGSDSKIHDVWVEHFECGAWIAGYDPPYPIDITTNLVISRARFRNNYADGVNFCQGTNNSVVEYSSIRNSGDDGLAMWPNNALGAPQEFNNIFRYNTIENIWRAGGIAIFGGYGHQVFRNIIKDGVGGSAIRFTQDFPGYTFEQGKPKIVLTDNYIVSCGTSYDLWNQMRGAIEFFTPRGIYDLEFNNTQIINSQRHAINFEGSFTNVNFNNTRIDGTGMDAIVDQPGPNIWGGYGIRANASGNARFTTISYNRLESGEVINHNTGFQLVIDPGVVALTGIALTPTSTSIVQGATATLQVAYTPSNATNKNVTWTSSNTSVASVVAAGTGTATVTANAVGTATITVTSQDGNFSRTCTVTVTPAVTISAPDATAGEGGNTGTFRISTGSTSSNITVGYTISGTAASGDYTSSPALSGSVTLTSSAPAVNITITPVDDSSFEGAENLTLTLQPGSGYNLGGATTATISIADNENPPCTAPVIGFTSTVPTIDQSIDAAWNNVPSGTLSNVTLGSMPSDFAGSKWRAMYDNTNLYVLVEVKDNVKTNDSGGSWWEDDVVEIFIDGDNSKGTAYDGQNDFQLGFRYNDTNINVGGNSVNRTTGIVFAIQNVTGGYNLEARIPWSTIGVTPSTGNRIGFDVSVDDDDNGGTRDSQVSAFATTSMGWSNPQLFGSVYLTTCGGNVPVTGVSLSPTSATVCVGATQQLSATIAPSNATNQNVTWSSSNTTVATVNSSGLVTGVSAGTANITVTTQDGARTATSAITVSTCNVPVTGVTVSPTSATVNVGATTQLTATVAPSNATNKNVSWSSSNTAVATVNGSGLVSGVSQGAAVITVTTQDGGRTATSNITVNTTNVPVTGVTLSPTSASVNAGATTQLTATVAPSNATNKNVSWSSSNTAVATVNSSGLVTGVAAGTATITVTTQDQAKTATATITVTSGQSAYPTGTPWAIPGTIEAENFDTGGEGVAYHDNEAANQGGQGRLSEGVDTENCSAGGLNIGWTGTGEWYEYTVNVTTAGTYTVDVRTASIFAGGTFHIEFNGVDRTGLFTTTNTGQWQTWTTISKTGISLNAGIQVMRIYLDNANYNIDKVIFSNGNIPVTGVSVSPTSATIAPGATQQLTATVAPSNATNKNVSWSSSNSAVATVNSSGVVTGVANGTATITVTTQDGARTATSAITVSSTDPAGVITCYRAPGSITINGQLTETGWNVTRSVSKAVIGSPNNTVTFGVMWDNTNLYIGARVLDANLFSDSPNAWEDDAIEIYIDANNNKLASYDGSDNQIIKNYNKSSVVTKFTLSGLQHGWAAVSGGYTIEVAVPWSSLSISPSGSTQIGFDIGYNDDDNGGAREHQAMWNGTVDNWQNTSAFGTLRLNTGNSARSVTASLDESEEVSVSYWPTEVTEELNITCDGTYEKVEVVDLLGRSYLEESISGKQNITLNVSSLSGGLHIVRMKAPTKSHAFRIIKR